MTTTTSVSNATGSTLPKNAQIGILALAQQGQYGAVSEVARQHEVSRGRVYRARETAEQLLKEGFAEGEPEVQIPLSLLPVDEKRIRRFIAAARVEGINSLRAIQRLLVYAMEATASYRFVRETLQGVYKKANLYNESVRLDNVKAVAPDELFSQGKPVLAAVDLGTGFVVSLKESERRDEAAWTEALNEGKAQGLVPEVAVKDAGQAMRAAFNAVHPNCEQRDDCFHAQHRMTKALNALEGRAYKRIRELYEAEDAARRVSADPVAEAKQEKKLLKAREACDKAIDLFDMFSSLCRQAKEAMEFCDLSAPVLRAGTTIAEDIQCIAKTMRQLNHPKISAVARYLEGRAEGLGLYADALQEKFAPLHHDVGSETAVILACWIWRLIGHYKAADATATKRRRYQKLLGALARLQHQCGGDLNRMHSCIQKVFQIIEERYRASSLIENFNSVIRPYLTVHKTAGQGFLDLFRAWRNLRIQTWWGKNQGKSAHECLTGERVDDWLTKLGFPPSPAYV